MKHLSLSMLPALLLLVCMRQRLGGRLCKLLTADEQYITDRSYHLIVGSFSSIYYMYISNLARMNKRSTHGSPYLFGSSFILLFRHLPHWTLVHGLHTSRDRRRIYNGPIYELESIVRPAEWSNLHDLALVFLSFC